MKKIIFCIFIAAFICLSAFAQENDEGEKKPVAPRTAILYAGYFGENISHPGMSAGVDFPIFSKGIFDLFSGLQLGYYYHRLNNHGAFAQALLRAQWTFGSGFFMDTALGAGYLHVFPDGTIYELQNGQAVAVPNYGNANFMPSLSLGAGYKLWDKTALPLSLSLNLGIFGEYPFNTYLFPRLFASLSCFYRLNGASK